MALDQPLYTTLDSVRVRLANKVQFQADPRQVIEGELSNELFLQLVRDAETLVEQDLRSRYAVPFRSVKYGTFEQLPDHSRRAIRMVVDMSAVIMILNTDFGRGTAIDGSSYSKNLNDAYDAAITKLLGQDQEGKARERFRFSPPLEDLMLARGNEAADDGYKGTLIVGSTRPRGDSTYAEDQINDPALINFGARLW